VFVCVSKRTYAGACVGVRVCVLAWLCMCVSMQIGMIT